VDQFVAFTNSPPVQITKNGRAFSSDGENCNLAGENYVAFSKFLVDVVQHFESEGIHFNYLSPFNEPQWDWTSSSQEGSPYTNQEIHDITQKLDSVIAANQVAVKIQIGEAGAMHYLYEIADKPARGNQIDDFFVSSSPRYLGALPSVDKMISSHSYFTSAPVDVMLTTRERTHEKIATASVPLEFWQTEYCVLGDKEEIPASGRDKGMATALYVARLIHHDLTIAHASAWHWWTSISVYDYKDGLIYADKNRTDGNIEDTKLLWALGNYSRFIRPGSVRVGITAAATVNDPRGLMVSSYTNQADGTLVTVIINYSDTDENVQLKVKDRDVVLWQPYRTSGKEGEDLTPLPAVESRNPITIPKKSITTLITILP
jgi:O-glycosyl hydrolase